MNASIRSGLLLLIAFVFATACTTTKSKRAVEPAPQRAFFLGIAGHDSEAVFENEIRLAHRVLDERFCFSDAHFLVNKKQPAKERSALAEGQGVSVNDVSAALARYTQEATPNDILVLYIASHGKRSGIVLHNEAQGIDEIFSPTELSADLSRVPMREQIVFVSACYSGVFIHPLQKETRAVVSAADQSSPSFGCKSSRDLTFFGSAFWDKAPDSATLNRRYVLARQQIRQWEEALKLPSSNPLLFVGGQARSWDRAHCRSATLDRSE